MYYEKHELRAFGHNTAAYLKMINKGFTKEIHLAKIHKLVCIEMCITFDIFTLFVQTFFCWKALDLN